MVELRLIRRSITLAGSGSSPPQAIPPGPPPPARPAFRLEEAESSRSGLRTQLADPAPFAAQDGLSGQPLRVHLGSCAGRLVECSVGTEIGLNTPFGAHRLPSQDLLERLMIAWPTPHGPGTIGRYPRGSRHAKRQRSPYRRPQRVSPPTSMRPSSSRTPPRSASGPGSAAATAPCVPSSLDRSGRVLGLVRPGIVPGHHVAGPPFRDQDLLHIVLERPGIGGTLKDPRRSDSGEPQPSGRRDRLPVARGCPVDPLSRGARP